MSAHYPGVSGDVAVHRSGDVVVLGRRKTGVDASPLPGWWLRDRNGGLADSALDGPDWCLVDGKELFALLQHARSAAAGGDDPEPPAPADPEATETADG